VDFRPYFGIVVATNELIDSGSTGRWPFTLDGQTKTYGLVNLDRGAWDNVWAAHEMGHGYGLPHSFSAEPTVQEYGDGWDIMSALTFGGRFPSFIDARLGQSGPALSGAYRDQLGWIPSSERFHLNSLGGGALINIKLSALDGGPAGNPRLAKVALGFSNHYYAVEFRMAEGWDRGIGRDAVLVRRVNNGTSYLRQSTGGRHDLQAGDAVTDPGENLSISVLGIDSAQKTATVHIGPMPPSSLRTSATVTPRPNAAGWNNSAVDVDLTATAPPNAWVQAITTSATGADPRPTTAHSGSAARVRVVAAGHTNLVYAARTNTGTGEVPRKLPVKIDTIAPRTTASIVRSGGTNTITLRATDEAGGSGLKDLQYYAVGANPIPLTTTTQSTASFTVSAPGATTVFFWATDRADNVEGPHSRWLRPVPVVTPSTLDFFAPPGGVSPAQTVVLRNEGSTSLSIKGVTSTDAAFTVSANPIAPCGARLLPNASCRIDVAFNPFALSSYQGSLDILTDAPSPRVTVPLTGVGEPAKLEFNPGSLTFPATVLRKTSASQTASIRNPGRAPLILDEVTPGTGGDYVLIDDRCGPYPKTLSPGSECEVDIAFRPIYDGTRSGGLMVRSNVPGPMQVLPLTGDGIAQPEVTAKPADLDFGDQPLNTSGAPARFEVTNTGTAPLTISATAIAGVAPGDFRIVGGSCRATMKRPVVVPQEQSCDLEIDFRPTALGARVATVDVTSNAPGPASVITLAGTGISTPDITFDPTPLAFPNQGVGTSSASRTVIVTNMSGANVQLRGVELDGDARDEFVVTQETCASASLAPGDACDVSVEFAPGRIGLRTATLLLTDGAGTVHETPLQGTGTGAEITFEPATVDFGAWPIGATDRRDILIRNTGNAPAMITSVAPTTADFLSNQWCVGVMIGPGGYCSMRVLFSPKAGGLRQGELMVSSSAPGSPVRVPLSGIGTVPGITIGTSTLDFGAQTVGTASTPKSVTITSSGTAPLSMGDVKLAGANPGEFTLTENCSFRGHMPGDTCTVTVTFKPTAPGTRTAAVVIDSNAAGSPHTVTLTGNGT
jgi:Transmembrane protein 131-like N-terminal